MELDSFLQFLTPTTMAAIAGDIIECRDLDPEWIEASQALADYIATYFTEDDKVEMFTAATVMSRQFVDQIIGAMRSP